MYRSWDTDPSGLIIITLADGTKRTPTLERPDHIAIMRRIETEGTWRGVRVPIGRFTQEAADRWGLRVEWVRSMVFQESGGNPWARNPEVKPGPEDDGVGELQITSADLKRGYTDKQLEDPEINLDIGCRYIYSLTKRYGWDFPKISAAFNAGSVHTPYRGYENEWNMHCTRGHIDAEVSALNWQILSFQQAANEAFAKNFDLFHLLPDQNVVRELQTAPTDPAPPDDNVS